MHKEKRTQEQGILAWLKEGKGLSPMDALRAFGCFRLASRICDLRRKGHKIETDRSNKYAIYYLKEADNNENSLCG